MWIITQDLISDPYERSMVGVAYPSLDTVLVSRKAMPVKFRILDGDGEVNFTGFMDAEEDPFAPLDAIGRGCGCTAIQLFENGKWVEV